MADLAVRVDPEQIRETMSPEFILPGTDDAEGAR